MKLVESDICVLGAGICGILLAQKLKRLKPRAKVVLVDAGQPFLDVASRMSLRQRFIDYRESAWPGDYVHGQLAENAECQTMAVGGWALHWEGVCPRFSMEDLRLKSLYGFGSDWPLAWEELERHYCEAEEAIGVAGDPSPYPEDRRSAPYAMPGMPLSHTLKTVKRWTERGGLPTTVLPVAKNTRDYDGRPRCVRCDTCVPICPTGARYSPDHTLRRMVSEGQVELHSGVLIRRLKLDGASSRVAAAVGVSSRGEPGETEFRSKVFVLALGKYWTPHLLLLSASPRFPDGLANSSGLVGKYMSGNRNMVARIRIEGPLYYGMHVSNGLTSREFFRCSPGGKYLRHDTYFTTNLNPPSLTNERGEIQIGDELLSDWRRNESDLVRVAATFALHAARDSGIVLDATRKNRWGDPLPLFREVLDRGSGARHRDMADHFEKLCHRLTKAAGGTVQAVKTEGENFSTWRSGGCRMSERPSEGVCDSYGRTFDHDNLFVVGAPTLPNPGLGSETLAFAALALRSATAIAKGL